MLKQNSFFGWKEDKGGLSKAGSNIIQTSCFSHAFNTDIQLGQPDQRQQDWLSSHLSCHELSGEAQATIHFFLVVLRLIFCIS